MTETELAQQAIDSVLLMFIGITAVIMVIPAAIVWWRLFSMAGKPGWAVLVPFYVWVVAARIGGRPDWWGWLVFASVFAGLLLTGSLSWLGTILDLAGTVILGMIIIEMARKYNRGVIFWLSAIIFPLATLFFLKGTKYQGKARA